MKKYIYINIAAIIMSLFSMQNAFAFDIDTGTSTSSCQNRIVNATATNIVSEANLSGTIYLCVNVGSNGPLTIDIDGTGYSSTTVVNDSNSNHAIYYTFSTTTLQNIGKDKITFKGTDSANNETINATLDINLEVKPLSMTNVKIDAGGGTGNPVALNGSIPYGEGVNYTCNNATEMYIESQPAGSTFSTSSPIISDYTGDGGGASTVPYRLVYGFMPNKPGEYKLSCLNIGGWSKRVSHTFIYDNASINIFNHQSDGTV